MNVVGFKTVFDEKEFKRAHQTFLDDFVHAENTENALQDMRQQIADGTLHPAYLYNKLQEIVEKASGDLSVYAVIGITTVASLAAFSAGHFFISEFITAPRLVVDSLAVLTGVWIGAKFSARLVSMPRIKDYLTEMSLKRYTPATVNKAIQVLKEEYGLTCEQEKTYRVHEGTQEYQHGSVCRFKGLSQNDYQLRLEFTEIYRLIIERKTALTLITANGRPVRVQYLGHNYYVNDNHKQRWQRGCPPLVVPDQNFEAFQRHTDNYITLITEN